MLVPGPWTDSTLPPSLPDQSVWPRGVRSPEDDARVAAYAAALAFYQGAQWPDRPRRGESRLVFNYARTLIPNTASYVSPGPVSFSAVTEPVTREAGNHAERLLARIASEHDFARLDLALAIDAAVLGDAAIKVTWHAARA